MTSLNIFTGKDSDNNAARFLVNDDLKKGIDVSILIADKGYDDCELHMYCGNHEIFPAIALKKQEQIMNLVKQTNFGKTSRVNRFTKKVLLYRTGLSRSEDTELISAIQVMPEK